MNRLHFLQRTLPSNLKKCRNFGNAEVILLDYNSCDRLADWVKNEMAFYIENKTLVYLQMVAPKPTYFSHPHSRNIAFRLATGNILCNVNADYFVNDGFFNFIQENMKEPERVAYIANFENTSKDNYGRLCVRKSDFLTIGGFDENFAGYGYEDTDLCMRLRMSGVQLKYLPQSSYADFLGHQDSRRIENMKDSKEISTIFLSGIENGQRTILFIFENGECQAGDVVKSSHSIPNLTKAAWDKGHWHQTNPGRLDINFASGKTTCLILTKENPNAAVNHQGTRFNRIDDPSLREKLILKKSQIQNYRLLKDRLRSGNFVCNHSGFGAGQILKNFTETITLTPIETDAPLTTKCND
jgi:hypothetical protein